MMSILVFFILFILLPIFIWLPWLLEYFETSKTRYKIVPVWNKDKQTYHYDVKYNLLCSFDTYFSTVEEAEKYICARRQGLKRKEKKPKVVYDL